MQFLYQVDLTGEGSEAGFDFFWENLPVASKSEDSRELAQALVRSVLSRRAEIDVLIAAASENWQVERISRVDLNLIRLAVAELLWSPEVPGRVVVDEAVEIARRFSDSRSAAFINGILDRVAREHGRLETQPR